MKTKTFEFGGSRYFIRGRTDDEIFEKMVAKRVELELALMEQKAPPMKVDDWFEQFMRTYKSGLSDYTYKCYEGTYHCNIQPSIGDLPLSAVKPIMCQMILNNIAHLSDSSIKKTFFLLRALFVKAYENDLIDRVPVKGLEPPKGYKNERRSLTDEERKTFIKAAENGRNSGLFCKIIYYCGLRPSEVARIRGGDYKDGVLHVRGKKTKAATRDVPIPVVLHLPELDQGELMFKTSSGNMIDKKRIRAYWLAIRRGMDADNSDLTLYCLRHDYCTRLEEAGVPLNVASRLMGHSSVEITSKIYTHASPVTFEAAKSLINQHLSVDKTSQNVTKKPIFRGFPQPSYRIKKCPNPLKFKAFSGAPRAIRTRNLLIRSDRRNVEISSNARI